MAVAKDFYFKFVPADWENDAELRMVSLAAQGLWVRLLCVAFRNGGKVLINGTAPTPVMLGRLVGVSAEEVEQLLEELLVGGVASRVDGVIVSRRMTRECNLRAMRVEVGSRGGRPRKETIGAAEKQTETKPETKPETKHITKTEPTAPQLEIELELEDQDQDQRPRDRAPHAVLTRLAHEVFEQIEAGQLELDAAKETLKTRAARLRLPYDSGAVTRALDSAEFQRRRA